MANPTLTEIGMDSVMAAGTLAGERVTHQVTFPAVGDQQLDAISGILKVFTASGLDAYQAAVVLKYLLARVEQQANAFERYYSQGGSVNIPQVVGMGNPSHVDNLSNIIADLEKGIAATPTGASFKLPDDA